MTATDLDLVTEPHVCECVQNHSPSAYEPNHHHILPQSWGGLTVASNLIWLCPNSHTSTHQLLNAYIHAGGSPAWEVLRRYNVLVRTLASQAWIQRPSEHPPYTLAHGST